MGGFPHALPHLSLNFQYLLRDTPMQGSQKTPEGTLRRQPQHLQNAHQHRLACQKLQMMQSRKSNVESQHHGQNELIHGHRSGLALHRQGFFHQLLELQFLQQGCHGQQSTVSSQIFAREVKTRGSIDFCGLRRVLSAPLFDGLFRATLAPVYHHLGDLLRIGW